MVKAETFKKKKMFYQSWWDVSKIYVYVTVTILREWNFYLSLLEWGLREKKMMQARNTQVIDAETSFHALSLYCFMPV